MDKICKSEIFKTLDIKQGRTVIPKRHDKNGARLLPAFCLQRAFTLCAQKGYPGREPSPRVKQSELRSGGAKVERILQIRTPEKTTKTCPEVCSGFLEY